MKVLLIHNYYKQRGGEDESFEAEAELLKSYGHETKTYTRHNGEIDQLSKTQIALRTTWNRRTVDDLNQMFEQFVPDVIHCTNLFPLISPSVYDAAKDARIPVVQSLRNYRQMCLNSLFFRDGKLCERCKNKSIAWAGVVHGCYRDNRFGSAVVATHNLYHRLRGTWQHRVDRFFTPTNFARTKYIESGLPAEKIAVKPNFLFEDPGPGREQREFALFVGRLSPEKGVRTLVETWQRHSPKLPLRIVGDGLLDGFVKRAAAENSNIVYEGRLTLEQVTDLIGRASFLVMPSEWFETFGRTIMEAFSKATPVIASRLGAMEELIEDGKNGLTFTPGNADELAARVTQMVENEELTKQLSKNARMTFENQFTAENNHESIMQIYSDAIEENRRNGQQK